MDKFEKKQADFASSVEKKHDKFQEVLNKMSENIVKLVEPSNEAEVQRLILNVQYFSKIRKILKRSLCCYKTWLEHLVI